jgi:hypothetical protein
MDALAGLSATLVFDFFFLYLSSIVQEGQAGDAVTNMKRELDTSVYSKNMVLLSCSFSWIFRLCQAMNYWICLRN